MIKTVIYPGTFDPITNGHVDIVHRASKLFDQIIIGVATASGKSPLFSLDQRLFQIKGIFSGHPNIKIQPLSGLLVDFAKQNNAVGIIRGVRNARDFDYEFQLSGINQTLNSDIETVFLTPSESVRFISSGLVKEVASLGGDVSKFVPDSICQALEQYYGPKNS